MHTVLRSPAADRCRLFSVSGAYSSLLYPARYDFVAVLVQGNVLNVSASRGSGSFVLAYNLAHLL